LGTVSLFARALTLKRVRLPDPSAASATPPDGITSGLSVVATIAAANALQSNEITAAYIAADTLNTATDASVRDLAIGAAVATEVVNRNTAIGLAVAALVDGAPAVLDTLGELATALAGNAAFATTVLLKNGATAMTGALTTGAVTSTGNLTLSSSGGSASTKNVVVAAGTRLVVGSIDSQSGNFTDSATPLTIATRGGSALNLSSSGPLNISSHMYLGSNRIQDVADPVNPQDVATKAYVSANSGSVLTHLSMSATSASQLSNNSLNKLIWTTVNADNGWGYNAGSSNGGRRLDIPSSGVYTVSWEVGVTYYDANQSSIKPYYETWLSHNGDSQWGGLGFKSFRIENPVSNQQETTRGSSCVTAKFSGGDSVEIICRPVTAVGFVTYANGGTNALISRLTLTKLG
jgi:hypothetical protein